MWQQWSRKYLLRSSQVVDNKALGIVGVMTNSSEIDTALKRKCILLRKPPCKWCLLLAELVFLRYTLYYIDNYIILFALLMHYLYGS
jgi:hypothetical protein